ncbi:MAG: hypothetical protein MJ072_06010, partial [Clostridia bacterium]|nr:hypothetical protein [Clostridia bacterium]
PFEDLQTVPKWLASVSVPSDKFSFKGLGEGSGRNQELFNYIVYLQSKGFTREEIRETIEIINTYVFAEPLGDYEIGVILRDEAFKPDDVIAEQIQGAQKRAAFQHDEFGNDLIDMFNIISVNGQLYIYSDGYYRGDDRIIEGKMIELFPQIKQAQRREVLEYIKIKTHIPAGDLKVDPYVINLTNTRINLKTGELLDHTPDAIEFDRIPAIYDPDARSADVDKMLNRVFCGDSDVIKLFEEMLGAILIKHNRYQKAFMLYGAGSTVNLHC